VAHAFDTRAPKPARTLIQQGAVALLAGLKRPTGYLVDVIAFGAVVRTPRDEDGIAMLVDAIAGRAPSIAIATGDRASEPQGIGGFGVKSQIELLVYFASSHARNQQLGRQEIDVTGTASDQADPGLHVMLEHASELLIGQRCGGHTSIKGIRPDHEGELVTTPAVTIWLQTYQITLSQNVNEWRNATQLLESIGFGLTVHGADPWPLPPSDADTINVEVSTHQGT